MLKHRGFDGIRVIDGANDGGADIIALRGKEVWVVQCKFTQRPYIDDSGVNDCDRALRRYGASKSLLITNAMLSPKAKSRVKELKAFDVPINFLEGKDLADYWQKKLSSQPVTQFTPRPYQEAAAEAVLASLEATSKGLLIMATGLGKTAVAGMIISELIAKGYKSVLFLAHLKDLVEQLEANLWSFLPKDVNSRFLHGDTSIPDSLDGITVATPDAALKLAEYNPDLIVVDEAHHVSSDGQYSKILNFWGSAPRIGLTATPWRGDQYDIQNLFGPASFKMGLAEGMAQGWLAEVNYKIYTDNVNWDAVQAVSANDYSVNQLNRLLFIEERDEKIVDELLKVWEKVNKPQAIIFCATIEHAKRMAGLLRRSSPIWARAEVIHSDMPKRERQVVLNSFKAQSCPVLTCVDVFNEGVDVPDVSIVAFLRVTHSRRIFVQQIGRGLRLADGKERLEVLDFVTDIRRIKEVLDLKASYDGELETLGKAPVSTIEFANEYDGNIIEQWLQDAASLDDDADDVRLNFPADDLPLG
jgi:superfamily II DNA or RNA helicase